MTKGKFFKVAKYFLQWPYNVRNFVNQLKLSDASANAYVYANVYAYKVNKL